LAGDRRHTYVEEQRSGYDCPPIIAAQFRQCCKLIPQSGQQQPAAPPLPRPEHGVRSTEHGTDILRTTVIPQAQARLALVQFRQCGSLVA